MIRAQYDSKDGITLWRYDRNEDGSKRYWTHDGKYADVKAGQPAPWWIVLSSEDADALISVLADFATIRTPEYAYLEGELKATKLHLSDMRRMAILEPPTGQPQESDV